MNLNIDLAWRRFKNDVKNKHFLIPYFLHSILELDLSNWLVKLKSSIEGRSYTLSPMEVVELPKGKGLIRPGSALAVADNVIYFALVQECLGSVFNRIAWSQGQTDFGYILSKESLTSNYWFKNHIAGWRSFRQESIRKIKEEGYQYVILTDITGFYENIDIPTLISDLRSCEVSDEIISQLSKCFNRWSQVPGKGIPQTNSASDVLAKLYLDSIDLALRNDGFSHVRYVDDIRIFCRNRREAKESLMMLSRILRRRGLNLQSSKTQILTAKEALEEIEGVQPVINEVTESSAFAQTMFSQLASNPYGNDEGENVDLVGHPNTLDAVQLAFKKYFLESNDKKFNKTLFHFLINRLIREKSSFAFDYCMANLEVHPEETEYLLKYSESFDDFDLKFLELKDSMITALVTFLKSPDAVYDYQNYQIIYWLMHNIESVPSGLLDHCRNTAFNSNKPYYLRLICRVFLGSFGNAGDLDRIETQLTLIIDDQERSDLVCCLKKLEKSRRNSLFARIENDGFLTKLAVNWTKGG